MIRYLLLFFLLPISYTWAQLHPQGHQYLKEVLNYEYNTIDSYLIYLAIPEGLDESGPLHFYQNPKNGVARLSTYYFRKSDSLVTKSIHQWSKYDDLFKPNRSWSYENIGKLKNKYKELKNEMTIYFGEDILAYKNTDSSATMHSEAIKWQTPLLYDPILEYRDLDRGKDMFGVVTLIYVHQGWEEQILEELHFIQYYFFSKIKEKDYEEATRLLDKALREKANQGHLEGIHKIIDTYTLEFFDFKENFSNLEREYIYMYRLIDENKKVHYMLNLVFNNNLDIIFLQYNPIE